MAGTFRAASAQSANRRSFLKRIAFGVAALGAYAVLSKRPFGGAKRVGRSIPADLPGEGSSFQPRGDARPRR